MKNLIIVFVAFMISLPSMKAQEEASKVGSRTSLYLGLRSLGNTEIPNINFSTVKPIGKFARIGIGLGYQQFIWINQLGFSGKLEANILPIVEEIADMELGLDGLEVYLGFQGGYTLSFSDFSEIFESNDLNSSLGFSHTGFYVGGRYFFSKGMGVMLELGKLPTGINSVGLGLVFGKN